MSEDIRYRQHRYLIMMAIRTLCFAVAVIMFANHLRWLVLIPAVGAIFIPYIAVIFANGGREPDNTRGFLEHRVNLPPARPVRRRPYRPATRRRSTRLRALVQSRQNRRSRGRLTWLQVKCSETVGVLQEWRYEICCH